MILILISGLIGGLISRWHGGGFNLKSSKTLKNIVWAAPFALCSVFPLLQYTNIFVAGLIEAMTLLLCLSGKATGHGGGMDLGHSTKEPYAGRKPEKLEYLILWLHGKISQYHYDAILLAIIGFAAVSGGVLVFGYLNIWAGFIIAVGGLLKSFSYMIGWALSDDDLEVMPNDLREPTAVGEFLTGFFAYSSLAIATMMVI